MPLLKADQKFGEGLDMNRWLVVRKIGEGQFAEVYEVIDLFEKDEQRVRTSLNATPTSPPTSPPRDVSTTQHTASIRPAAILSSPPMQLPLPTSPASGFHTHDPSMTLPASLNPPPPPLTPLILPSSLSSSPHPLPLSSPPSPLGFHPPPSLDPQFAIKLEKRKEKTSVRAEAKVSYLSYPVQVSALRRLG